MGTVETGLSGEDVKKLARVEDCALVSRGRGGEAFSVLYKGGHLAGTKRDLGRPARIRLAFRCRADAERTVRIYAASVF